MKIFYRQISKIILFYESANARLSASIHTSTETVVEFTNEILRNPVEYYSVVYLVGS